jgi:hypothetical protein
MFSVAGALSPREALAILLASPLLSSPPGGSVVMTACAYRSLEPVLRQRVAELRARQEQDAVFVDVAHGVASRRIGRAVGGAVGVVMALAAFAVGLMGLSRDGASGAQLFRITSTELLLVAWPAVLVARILARFFARPLLSMGGRIPMSGNPSVDLARLQTVDPLRAACDLARSWERRSAALPMAAASLLAPLSLHAFVWFPLAHVQSLASGMDDFGTWIGVSILIVGHAHLALLVCAVRWAYKLRSVETAKLRVGLGRAWGTALLVSAGVACLPGIVLLAIPPLLVVVTGLAFVPLMYHRTALALDRERRALEAT